MDDMIDELCANLRRHESALRVLRAADSRATAAEIERLQLNLQRCERWLCLLGGKHELERVRALPNAG